MLSSVARIIDANFNRAREAVRVMEDYARFIQNDPAGCEAAKRLRHDLAAAYHQMPVDELLCARDTPNDVGTTISTPTERTRQNACDVLTAAAKRLPEALRTIEEYTKTFDASLAAIVEAIRYRAYDLEQRLMLRSSRSSRFAAVRLYVLVTASLCRKDWRQTAADAIAAGAGCLQFREKKLDDDELLKQAREMSAICRERGALFIVNDRPDIAALADADGVHLGQTDMGVREARRIVGPGRLIGLSTHTPEQFRAAVRIQPDYIAVGPMFQSPTKPQDHVPGPALLALAAGETGIPVVAIGGITPENLPRLAAVGLSCAAACSAVIAAADVQATCRRFLDTIPQSRR
ncbi:MAG TPA: thiamine phosphate synthase [Phycisphaerae bacterium]|nr:thiamine phosphate synthase [Phycisphaerae bacterium]